MRQSHVAPSVRSCDLFPLALHCPPVTRWIWSCAIFALPSPSTLQQCAPHVRCPSPLDIVDSSPPAPSTSPFLACRCRVRVAPGVDGEPLPLGTGGPTSPLLGLRLQQLRNGWSTASPARNLQQRLFVRRAPSTCVAFFFCVLLPLLFCLRADFHHAQPSCPSSHCCY